MKSIHIKKKIRKCTAVMLALVMVFGMLPVAASAETTATKDISTVYLGTLGTGNTYYYTGEPVEPYFFLSEGNYYDNGKYLREGIDYVVTYEDNVYPDPDKSYNLKAVITGIGEYFGTRTETFSFKRTPFDSRLTRVKLDETIYDYTGEPICPKPHVYYDGRELVENVDYVLEYEDNVDVSTRHLFDCGKIKVVGINNFTSSTQPESAYFYIAPPVEPIGPIERTDRDDNYFKWSIDEEGLLSLDVRSHDGKGIVLPGEAASGFSDEYDDEAHEWIHISGYNEYSTSVRKVKITGDVSVVTGFTNYLFLTDVELPDGVTTIRGNGWGTGSLGGNYNLRHINLPDSLTTIEVNALSSCPLLTVDLPDGITYFRACSGEVGSRSPKFMVTLNSTTEETLKNSSYSYCYYIKGYPDFNVYFKEKDGFEGKARTLFQYTGTDRNVVIPDFIEAISGSYGNTFYHCPVRIESEIIPGSVKWLDHYLSDESKLKYVEIKPGALKSLPNNFLGYKFGTTISLPETLEAIDEPSNYNICQSSAWIIAEVVEGSPMHDYVIAKDSFKEDDGSGVGNRYRIKSVLQPTVTPSYVEIRTDKMSDVYASKNDGSFTFDSLLYKGQPLAEGTDYTATQNVITIKEDCMERLGTGTHEFTLHYTGTAGEENIKPVDPVLMVEFIARSVPVLKVTGNDGADITDDCVVVWKTTADKEVEQPVSVSPGTKLKYVVTPKDTLKVDGIQYYKSLTGEVTLKERTQNVDLSLTAQGTVTVTPTSNNGTSESTAVPNDENASYKISWYTRSGDKYTKIGSEAMSSMTDAGTTLYCDITMTGKNAENYPNAVKVPVQVTFAANKRNVELTAKNNVTLNISGKKKNGDNITADDYIVTWYTKTDDGFKPTGLTGSKLLNLGGSVDTEYYYEITPKDYYINHSLTYNWAQFHGIPASDKTKIKITDKPQNVSVKLEPVKTVTVTGTIENGSTVGFDNLDISVTHEPFAGYTGAGSYYSYGKIWSQIVFTKTPDGKAVKFTAELNDLEATVRAADSKGNFQTAYTTVLAENLSKPMDPQGIVYEAVLSNPVEGAEVTLYERTSDGAEVLWNAEDYGQINPQTTNSSGMYQWFVPEGEWQVRVTAPAGSNLQNNTSADHENANKDDGSTVGWLPVAPVQMGINIPLVSTDSPVVDNVSVSSGSIELNFSMYMDVSTLTDKAITISNENSNVSCKIDYPDKEPNPQNDKKQYAKTVVITPTDGKFETGIQYTLSVTSDAAAYNGKPLTSYDKSFMFDVDKSELTAIIAAANEYYEEIANEYKDAAKELKAAIDEAQAAADKASPKASELNKAKKDLNDAMSKAAADTLAADKKAFEEYKEEHKQKADSLAKEDDSQASKDLIVNPHALKAPP